LADHDFETIAAAQQPNRPKSSKATVRVEEAAGRDAEAAGTVASPTAGTLMPGLLASTGPGAGVGDVVGTVGASAGRLDTRAGCVAREVAGGVVAGGVVAGGRVARGVGTTGAAVRVGGELTTSTSTGRGRSNVNSTDPVLAAAPGRSTTSRMLPLPSRLRSMRTVCPSAEALPTALPLAQSKDGALLQAPGTAVGGFQVPVATHARTLAAGLASPE
jgi:hypothetical protein